MRVFNLLNRKLKNKQKKIDFALELAPRFGKTIWTIDLIQTLFNEYGYKICFLPAYVLTVFKSFEKDFYDFKGYSNNIIYLKKGDDVENRIPFSAKCQTEENSSK